MQRELLTYQRTQSKDSIPITVLRKNQLIETSLFNVYDETDKVYKCGLYVKDKIVGVGTLTYYDPSNHTYGCLLYTSSADFNDGCKSEIQRECKRCMQ